MDKRLIIRKLTLGLISLALAGFCYQYWETFKWFTAIETFAQDFRLRSGRWCPLDTNHFEYIGIEQSKYDGRFHQILDIPEDELTPDQQILREVSVKGYPWSRAVWATFVERVMSAGARCVIMDIVFPNEGAGDEEFARVLEKYKPRVVVGSMFEEVDDSTIFLTPSPSIIPMDMFGENSEDERVGLVNIYPDEDGYFRRGIYLPSMWDMYQKLLPPEVAANMGDLGKDVVLESLAARATQLMGKEEKLPEVSVAPMIRFTGPPEARFKVVSLDRVLDPDVWQTEFVDKGRVKDKLVLVGPYANFFHDEHSTPFGIMKGPEYHLNMINAALHGEFIDELTIEQNKWIVLGAGFLTICMTLLMKRYILRFVLGMAMTVGYGVVVMSYYNRADGLMIGAVAVPMILVNTNNVLTLALESFWAWLDKRDFEATMGRYFSPAVMKEVRENPGSLDAKSADVTLLLTDLRNSTPLAEKLGPKGMFGLLNQVFEAQIDAIMNELGNLEHFLGDQFLSYWGAPNDQPDGPNQSLRAARDLIIRMDKVKQLQSPEVRKIFGYGVALHTGHALVGNKGSEKKMEYGLVGDTINEAARIEALTKYYGTQLLVSEELFKRLSNPGLHRIVDRVIVKGKSEPVVLYELECLNTHPKFKEITREFEAAFKLYEEGRFEEAKAAARKLVEEFDDGPSKVVVDRCEQLLAEPPADWNGVWKMTSK